MNLLQKLALLVLCGASAGAAAQSYQDLVNQYDQTCSPAQLARLPEMKQQCEMLKSTLDSMGRSQAKPSATRESALVPDSVVDNSTQCACTRKLGRCTATARVTNQIITRTPYGLSSKVMVRTDAPLGQCAEVTVFLQETAHRATGSNRQGHPLYQVIKGTNDIEWRNVGTSATRLEYQVLPDATECFICDASKGGNTGAANATDRGQDRPLTARDSYEIQYRDCLAARGELYSKVDSAMRSQLCAGLKDLRDREPR